MISLIGLPINLSVSEALTVLKPLLLFVIGMVVYSIFVFKFYRLIARKDIFELNLKQYNIETFAWLKKISGVILYTIEYVLLFPVFTFFWFITLSILLSFMAKEQTVNSILLISIALVSAVRITAYYHEDLSKDLAKMLPFALLGIFLVDISYFSASSSLDIITQIPSMWEIMFYYLVFAIALEFLLRISHSMGLFKTKEIEK